MNSSTQKSILIGTIVLMVLLVVGNFIFTHIEPTSSYSLNTNNQPTIGNLKAATEVVVFEEPKCSACRDYHNTVFPKIKEEFIDTDQIKYSAIPVSFIQGSMPAAESLLCIYYQDEKKPNASDFFTFLNYLYLHQPPENSDWATNENLAAMIKKADPSINLSKIEKCMESHVYFTKIKQNTAEGLRVTKGNLTTPALFVNGVRVEATSVEAVINAIKKAIKS